MPDYQVFELGDVALQSGLTLRAARLAYKTYGSLNARKDHSEPNFQGYPPLNSKTNVKPEEFA